jgi:hypothetical protein
LPIARKLKRQPGNRRKNRINKSLAECRALIYYAKLRALRAFEWHFAEKEAADEVRNLFQKEGIKGIDVYYTPAINQTP